MHFPHLPPIPGDEATARHRSQEQHTSCTALGVSKMPGPGSAGSSVSVRYLHILISRHEPEVQRFTTEAAKEISAMRQAGWDPPMGNFTQKFTSMPQSIARLLDERVYDNDLLNKNNDCHQQSFII